MFHIDKFKHLHLIACLLQHRCAQAIGEKRCDSLLQKSIFQYRLQQLISDLTVQFMLAARHGKNRFCIPQDSLGQCIIRRCITRMQRHYQIYLITPLIIRDIAVQKFQFFIPKFFCQCITMGNHILFQIESRDPQIKALFFMQIVIHCKRQI